MKTAAVVLLCLGLAVCSCKKYVQQQEQNAVMNIITNGLWRVELFHKDTIDITTSFSSYSFQFRTDGTVSGISNSNSVTGTWSADVSTRTITSFFPSGSAVLNELDGVWTITDSSPDYVVANKSDSLKSNLKLTKE